MTEHDAGLFEKLRVLRKKLADDLSVPAFVVFSDATLRQMASSMPKDHDSFRKIKGVGESKLREFGDQFITIIAGHVTGNEDRVERKQSPAAETPVAAQVPRSVLSRSTADEPVRAATPAEKLLSRVVDRTVTITGGGPTFQRTLHSDIGKFLATLHEREAHILSRRFGLEDGRERTLREIGLSLGISRERVRQIEKKALRKLRHKSRLRILEALLDTNAAPGNASDNPDHRPPRREPESGSYTKQARKSHARAYQRWSAREDQQLKKLYESGQSVDEIASTLQRRPSAIRSRLEYSGLTSRNASSHMLTLNLIRAGLTIAEIARRRRIAEQTVITHLERLTNEGNAPDLTHLMPELPRYERIVQAFIEADSEYLKPVKDSLGDDYSYGELRLVRLQMSQSSQGNLNHSS